MASTLAMDYIVSERCKYSPNISTGPVVQDGVNPIGVNLFALRDSVLLNDGLVCNFTGQEVFSVEIGNLWLSMNPTSGNTGLSVTPTLIGDVLDIHDLDFNTSVGTTTPAWMSIGLFKLARIREIFIFDIDPAFAGVSSVISSAANQTSIGDVVIGSITGLFGNTVNLFSGAGAFSVRDLKCGPNNGAGVFAAAGAGVTLNVAENYVLPVGVTINGAVLPNLDTVTSSEPAVVTPPVSGTIYRNTFNTPITLYLAATYNPLAAATATVAVALGPGAAPPAIFTESEPAAITVGRIKATTLVVPAGWYYSFTAVNAVLNSLHAVTR